MWSKSFYFNDAFINPSEEEYHNGSDYTQEIWTLFSLLVTAIETEKFGKSWKIENKSTSFDT